MIKDTKIDAILYTSKTLADGSHPIMIRIREDGKRRYISTGCSCKKSQWNESTAKVKSSVYEALKINNKVGFMIGEIWQKIFAEQSKETSSDSAPTVAAIFDSLIGGFIDNERYGNRAVYSTTKNMLQRFFKNNLDFRIEAIDEDKLNEIDMYMRSNGLKDTTMHGRMRVIRAVWNYAIKHKYASRDSYPFDCWSLSRYNLKTEKRAITKDDVKKIIEYKPDFGDTINVKLARDMFTFSYLCGGMPFYDMCTLSEDKISSGTIKYKRKKTHLDISITIPDRAMEIIKDWRPQSKGYIFPILDKSIHTTEQSQRNRVHRKYSRINNALKKIGEKLGIASKLTTYVARHSFATVLKREGVSIDIISEALGHHDLSITKTYLDSFSNEQLLDAQSKLL